MKCSSYSKKMKKREREIKRDTEKNSTATRYYKYGMYFARVLYAYIHKCGSAMRVNRVKYIEMMEYIVAESYIIYCVIYIFVVVGMGR